MSWSGRLRRAFIRRMGASGYFEAFFVCAVASIVVLRASLRVTGYPRVGGGGLHISHMIWGGLLMLTAIALLLGVLTTAARRLAAVAGGIGFGVFIDELGKFITSDNNYFFRPTFALIYLIFVALYAALRYVAHRWPYSRAERLGNALALVTDAVAHDLDEWERERALRYIRQSLARDPAAAALATLLERDENAERATWATRARQAVVGAYRAVAAHRWALWVAVAVLIVQSIVYLAPVAGEVLPYGAGLGPLRGGRGFYAWGGALAAALVAGLIIVGVIRLAATRLGAYQLFRWALLVDIFVVQFFAFYWDQLRALAGFIASVVILGIVDYAIREEERADEQDEQTDG